MKLACSVLAWSPERSLREVLSELRSLGYSGIEVAPTRVWGEWRLATPVAAHAWARAVHGEGFSVPAMQAILYGLGDLKLFRDCAAIGEHLCAVAAVAEALDCGILVLGAPKMRKLDGLDPEVAFDRAVAIFRDYARICADHGTTLCLEPNPRSYGCEFVWTTEQAARLVQAVDHVGFGLHVDAAAMFMEGEIGPNVLRRHLGAIRHFHVSEPGLVGLSPNRVDHQANLLTLASLNYAGWVSLESTDASQFESSAAALANWRAVAEHERAILA